MSVQKSVAVVGSGIAGLSAAWLLSKKHHVTLYERDGRPGGHANTVDIEVDGTQVSVDTGFIVYNEAAYPNLQALFRHLSVETAPSAMGFAVSSGNGAMEYSGANLLQLFGHWRNIADPGHWRMVRDLVRFLRRGAADVDAIDAAMPLGDYLAVQGYSLAFAERHLLPMAGAIWSAAPRDMMIYPAAAFLRFFANHGLLMMAGRPQWRTVRGGSREYVRKLLADSRVTLRTNAGVERVTRDAAGVAVITRGGESHRHDEVVLATHPDQALTLLDRPSADERRLLGAIAYTRNLAYLHRDPSFMPRRRRLWASWNVRVPGSQDILDNRSVTYWMNALQPLPVQRDIFVTLNPPETPREGLIDAVFDYAHPMFDARALAAQDMLWSLQGRFRTWYCGAWFGSGFHEDGLQAGLAVAEQLGGLRRPWNVANESGRIALGKAGAHGAELEIAA